MSDDVQIEFLLRQAIATGVAPAIAFAVSRGQAPAQIWNIGATSYRSDATPITVQTPFDLASLTKPLTTTIWCLQLIEAGRLSFSSRIGDHVDVKDPALAKAPISMLLNHTTGLPAHRAYFRGLGPSALRSGQHASAQTALRRMLLATALDSLPGQVARYSDLGFLLLELICESVDRPLTERWIDLPNHGPDTLHFRTLPHPPSTQYAATEECPWRGRLLMGEVHDDNCWTIGGIGGHAGLFGTITAVHRMGQQILQAANGQDKLGISSSLWAASLSPRWMHARGTYVLGWDTPTPGGSTSGKFLSRHAFGHLGFTGTSLWIDPAANLVMTLLTNRVCPTRENTKIRAFRPQIHDAGFQFAQRCFT